MTATAPISFRTAPARGIAASKQRVDRKANAVYGAAIIQQGKLNEGDSRNWINDAVTLQQVIDFGNRGNKGLKARFTHPTMSDDGLGKYLGRWKDFRLDGETVRADLYLSETAFDTPNGDLASYVMDMAEEDPEAFGVSIAPSKLDEQAMREGASEDGVQPVRISAMHSADVVDQPAGTRDGFFSMDQPTSADSLPYAATWLIDHHFQNTDANEIRSRVLGFLDRYFVMRGVTQTVTETKPEGGSVMSQETKPDAATQPEALPDVVSADEAKLAERIRINTLIALCSKAKCPELAKKMVDEEMTIPQAQEILIDRLCLQAAVPDDSGDDPAQEPEPEDPDQAFRNEFRDSNEKYPGVLSMTEDEYVAQRRVDEGLDVLALAKR